MRKRPKGMLSLLVLLVCTGYLAYEYRDRIPLGDRLAQIAEKVPLLGTGEKEELPASWLTFAHGTLHYSLRYPEEYTVERSEDGHRVTFRDGGAIRLEIRAVTQEQRLKEGLWFSEELEPAQVGDRPGKRLVTRETTGESPGQRIVYMTEKGDLLYGLTFHPEGSDLGAVDRLVLESFRFDDPVATSPP